MTLPRQIMNESQLTETNLTVSKYSNGINSMLILSAAIASVGIVANMTVAVAFLNHRKLRKKIPNIFIINQVSRFNACTDVEMHNSSPVLVIIGKHV